MGSADATVTANWAVNKYAVTFNINGGAVSPGSTTVTYDSTYGTLPTLTRSGYTFQGWWPAASGGSQVINTTKVTITGAQTLYAHWTSNIKLSSLLIGKANAASVTTYTGATAEMYTFSHAATEQTGALIDYRYIGAQQ